MDEKHTHSTSEQDKFIKNLYATKTRKLTKIDSTQIQLQTKLEKLLKEENKTEEITQIKMQLTILDKIKLRLLKSNDIIPHEKAKTNKKPVKDGKQKALSKDLKKKPKYSKINYQSTLIKIYSDVNQCFKSISFKN